ncbi:hypothetical protein PINS_up001837 [Pythium insidiosum]|nr:hypothetical protein PINS_up001837 [Pythium insidiosum]
MLAALRASRQCLNVHQHRRAMTTKGFFATSEKGTFQREPSVFRNWIQADPAAEFPAEKGRYHLYISLACPWASRCLAMLELKGLHDAIGVSVVHPVFQKTKPNDPEDTHVGWAFVDPEKTPAIPGPSGLGSYSSKDATVDPINGAAFVRDLYERVTSQKVRYTVPVLWDKKKQTIVSNESSEIIRMFNNAFGEVAPSTHDYYPEPLRAQIDEINAWVYDDINNGVYKCGFASTQQAYDEAVEKLFAALDRVEEILGRQRFLVGDTFTEADLRLFVTLIRFDAVYYVHFKTSKRLIKDYPNLSNYTREIYQHPKIKPTVNLQHIKLHYYASHTHINTFGIVPVDAAIDLDAPHDRARFPATNWP